MDDIAIKVEHLDKTFKLPHEKQSSIKGALINFRRRGYEKQEVLKDINFEVKKGEFFGIVGRNGSGKSTLLKLISQIYTPDSGCVTVNGKLTPFIELGVGFNPELSGRENVFLNGALLGFNRREMEAMYEEIVRFAELERFMDQKLKNYSSGMQVRLAFSIAIRANTDILVLDEVLAVGDEAFQRKCDNFFNQIKKDKSRTVVLVTHSMDSVKKYCTRALLIKDGSILLTGSPNDVANRYTEENTSAGTSSQSETATHELGLNKRVPVLRNVPAAKTVLKRDEYFEFDIEYEFNEDRPFYLAFSLIDLKRGGIPYDSDAILMKKLGRQKVRHKLPLHLFNDTDFQVFTSLRVEGENGEKEMVAYTSQTNSCYFSVRNNDKKSSYALLRSLES